MGNFYWATFVLDYGYGQHENHCHMVQYSNQPQNNAIHDIYTDRHWALNPQPTHIPEYSINNNMCHLLMTHLHISMHPYFHYILNQYNHQKFYAVNQDGQLLKSLYLYTQSL